MDSTAPFPAAPSFPSFSRLPAELRLEIWRYALTFARTVRLTPAILTKEYETPTALHYYADTPPPALLHVCRESRTLALPHYTHAFRTLCPAAPVYVNFAQDTIECDQDDLPLLVDPPILNNGHNNNYNSNNSSNEKEAARETDLMRIRRLRLSVSTTDYFGSTTLQMVRIAKGLRALEIRLLDLQLARWSHAARLPELLDEIRVEHWCHPNWQCRDVSISNWSTGELMATLDDGVLGAEGEIRVGRSDKGRGLRVAGKLTLVALYVVCAVGFLSVITGRGGGMLFPRGRREMLVG